MNSKILHRATCPKCGYFSHADKRGKFLCCGVSEASIPKPTKVKYLKRRRSMTRRSNPDLEKQVGGGGLSEDSKLASPGDVKQLKLF